MKEAYYFYCENGASLTKTYRADRYQKIRDYYERCQELCRKRGYPQKVRDRIAVPFLSYTIDALKQECAWAGAEEPVRVRISRILEDPVLQQVLKQEKGSPTSVSRKALFWAMGHQLPGVCRLLIRLRERFPRRG